MNSTLCSVLSLCRLSSRQLPCVLHWRGVRCGVASDGTWRGPSFTPLGHACHDFANVLGRELHVAAGSAVRAAAAAAVGLPRLLGGDLLPPTHPLSVCVVDGPAPPLSALLAVALATLLAAAVTMVQLLFVGADAGRW